METAGSEAKKIKFWAFGDVYNLHGVLSTQKIKIGAFGSMCPIYVGSFRSKNLNLGLLGYVCNLHGVLSTLYMLYTKQPGCRSVHGLKINK